MWNKCLSKAFKKNPVCVGLTVLSNLKLKNRNVGFRPAYFYYQINKAL